MKAGPTFAIFFPRILPHHFTSSTQFIMISGHLRRIFLINAILLCTFCFSNALKIGVNRHQRHFSHLLSHSTSYEGASQLAPPLQVRLAENVLSTVFKIKPLFKMAAKKARTSMEERGMKIGVNWKESVGELEKNMEALVLEYDSVFNTKASLLTPEYYKKAFHAYDEGNLSWRAAMEVEVAALTVHAPIFANKGELDRKGDFELRDRFHRNMKDLFAERQFKPRRILDIGCSTGLSTLKLHDSFPDAEILGLDLSPYFLAVARHNLKKNPELESARKAVTYIHGLGENTSLGNGSGVDAVTMCLVSHELPSSASKAIFDEAMRILPSGGAFALMDMDPTSTFFQKFASNPFAFAAFKSTEPWIQEYVSMDLISTLESCGFVNIKTKPNSPRHRTVVAYKP